jgi:hypothetical protein
VRGRRAELALVEDRAHGLRGQGFGRSIPAEAAAEAHVHEGGRVALDLGRGAAAGLVVGPAALGDVAGAAGKAAAGGQSLLEEQLFAQLDRLAVSRGGVARIGDVRGRPRPVCDERPDFGVGERRGLRPGRRGKEGEGTPDGGYCPHRRIIGHDHQVR